MTDGKKLLLVIGEVVLTYVALMLLLAFGGQVLMQIF